MNEKLVLDEKLVGRVDFDADELAERYEAERRLRLRPGGKSQYIPTVSGRFESFSNDPWAKPLEREALREHTQVIVVGGGFGGLVQGARLFEQGVKDIRTIEIGGDFGGTWYWNRYPGAMCDIEAHIYLPLLEELNYAPKHRYAYAPEMLDLSQRIGREYGLYEKALFQTSVSEARWDEDDARWIVYTDLGDELTCDVLILACGRQSLPKLPGIPGLENFEGHIFHSSRWDYDYTGGDEGGALVGLKDKKVGVIGTGATGLQIVPAVAEDAQELFVFQRTPSTVGVRGQRETPQDWADMSQPGWQRNRRVNFQSRVQFGTRAGAAPVEADLVQDGWTKTLEVLADPFEKVEARLGHTPTPEEIESLNIINDYRVMNDLRSRVDEVVKNPAVANALKPYYRWWCKRPGWHDDYLDSFNRDNVHLVDTQGKGVESFTKNGVVVDGREYALDCVIMATGFEAAIEFTRLTGFELHGRDTSLTDHWRNGGPRTLHGMSTDKFPNLFFIGGNLQTVSSVNAVHLLDEQAHYVAHATAEFFRRGLRTIEPSKEAIDEWVEGIRTAPANKALFEFYLECTPGYYNNEGKAASMDELFMGGRYAGGALAYYDLLEKWAENNQFAGYAVVPNEQQVTV